MATCQRWGHPQAIPELFQLTSPCLELRQNSPHADSTPEAPPPLLQASNEGQRGLPWSAQRCSGAVDGVGWKIELQLRSHAPQNPFSQWEGQKEGGGSESPDASAASLLHHIRGNDCTATLGQGRRGPLLPPARGEHSG